MRSSKIFIATFLIICLVPFVFMFFVPTKAAANEILSPKPAFGADMLSQTADYVGDRFAFRQTFATAWARLNAVLFRSSAEGQVILGEDGWLYYADDFNSALCDEELESIAANVFQLQKQIEERGASFVFTVAPDKSSLHSEKLPAGFVPAENGRALEPWLEKYGVNYVSLFDEAIPYFATDSHWTAYGAALACDRLAGTDFASRDFSIESRHRGDLYEMLYPAGRKTESDPHCELDYETLTTALFDGNAITIETTSDSEGTLWCWRDSFGISLYPYLAQTYGRATFSRSVDYNPDAIGDADTVILEIVERNLGNLK